MTTFTNRLALIGATGIAVLGLLTACAAPNSGSDSSNGAKPGSAPSAQGENADQKFTDWQVKYAQCMREEGIDMPDPSGDGSMTLDLGATDAESYEKASGTCMSKVGAPPSRDGRSAEQVQSEGLKVAQCLRDAGYDYKDPEPGAAQEIRDDIPKDAFEKCGVKVQG